MGSALLISTRRARQAETRNHIERYVDEPTHEAHSHARARITSANVITRTPLRVLDSAFNSRVALVTVRYAALASILQDRYLSGMAGWRCASKERARSGCGSGPHCGHEHGSFYRICATNNAALFPTMVWLALRQMQGWDAFRLKRTLILDVEKHPINLSSLHTPAEVNFGATCHVPFGDLAFGP